jgi:hypothetical protein
LRLAFMRLLLVTNYRCRIRPRPHANGMLDYRLPGDHPLRLSKDRHNALAREIGGVCNGGRNMLWLERPVQR